MKDWIERCHWTTLAATIALVLVAAGLAVAGNMDVRKCNCELIDLDGGGGGDSTWNMDLLVETTKDSATVTVETDLDSASFTTDGSTTTLDTGYDKVSVVPDGNLCTATVYLNNDLADTVTAACPYTYYMNYTLVVANDACKDLDGDGYPDAPVKWESVYASYHEEDGREPVDLNITGVGYENLTTGDMDGPEEKYGELNGNPVVNAGSHNWTFGDYTKNWSLNYKRFIDGNQKGETGDFIVEEDC